MYIEDGSQYMSSLPNRRVDEYCAKTNKHKEIGPLSLCDFHFFRAFLFPGLMIIDDQSDLLGIPSGKLT
jgi:hypothetical protein